MFTTIIGLLGGSFGAFLAKMIGDVFSMIKTKQENKHEIEMNKIDHAQEMEMRKFSLDETKKIKAIEFDQSEMENSFAESITVQKTANSLVGKTASIIDKINKMIRPTFAYTFLGFFLIAKFTIIYGFIKCGVYDAKTVFMFGKEIWDKDTQTVFFTIVGFIYTARHLNNAEEHVYNKKGLYK